MRIVRPLGLVAATIAVGYGWWAGTVGATHLGVLRSLTPSGSARVRASHLLFRELGAYIGHKEV